MTPPPWRAALRRTVVAAGAGVALLSVLALRLADWRIYAVYVLLSVVLFLPYVEVLPGLPLPIPQMAATIGFLYIGGLPIIVLENVAPVLTQLLRRALPAGWRQPIPQLRAETGAAQRRLFAGTWAASDRPRVVAEMATFAVGLGVRWGLVSLLVPHGLPITDVTAIVVAECGGYASWGLLAILPIYPDQPLLALPSAGGVRTALADIGLIIVLALTPFVFLISYGFQTHGLVGAAAWALSALGLHFMLKRLNERRVMLEEQNRRLETLNRELEHRERLSAIGKMSSIVSHQLLQQLGVIGLYADLIRNCADDDPAAVLAQVRRSAGAIEDALRDVNRVMTDLLVFSKDLRLNLYEQPLAEVVTECVDECRPAAQERGVHLQIAHGTECTVILDKLKMKQALGNVLRNAIEASLPADTVLVRTAESDGSVEIAVSDHGPGIPGPDADAVFTPFFTTKEHGTGLGLAIARQFVEAHGGQLRVEKADLRRVGATFVLRLPLRPAHSRDAGSAGTSAGPSAPAPRREARSRP
jgi:signal transduction histidine kinase